MARNFFLGMVSQDFLIGVGTFKVRVLYTHFCQSLVTVIEVLFVTFVSKSNREKLNKNLVLTLSSAVYVGACPNVVLTRVTSLFLVKHYSLSAKFGSQIFSIVKLNILPKGFHS